MHGKYKNNATSGFKCNIVCVCGVCGGYIKQGDTVTKLNKKIGKLIIHKSCGTGNRFKVKY